jgi:ribonuclease P protein subunit RPR2
MSQGERRPRGRKPAYQTDIAKERIEILLGLAERDLRQNPDRSRRYVQLARKIGMRYNVRIPSSTKRSFCKRCGTLLRPGLTSSQRTSDGKIGVTCLHCRGVRRTPIAAGKKAPKPAAAP